MWGRVGDATSTTEVHCLDMDTETARRSSDHVGESQLQWNRGKDFVDIYDDEVRLRIAMQQLAVNEREAGGNGRGGRLGEGPSEQTPKHASACGGVRVA